MGNDMLKTIRDWDTFSGLDRSCREHPILDVWFGETGKKEWVVNKATGVGAALDNHKRVRTLFYFSKGIEGAKTGYAGPLPGGLTWATSRNKARLLFGETERSIEPSGGVFGSEWARDRWEIPHADGTVAGWIGVEYTAGDVSIRQIDLTPNTTRTEPSQIELTVYADYYQFYVADRENSCDTAVIWDDPETTKRQFAMGDQLIAIATKRYGNVPVRIETYPDEPKLDPRGIDRINQGGLEIKTTLGVGNYISSELAEVPVAPGIYAVRVLYLYQTSADEASALDEYVVQLWPVDTLPGVTYLKPKATKPKPKKPGAK